MINLHDIETELENLKQLKDYLEIRLQNLPEGKLKISNIKGHPRYYLTMPKEYKKPKYLDNTKAELIQDLANKSYWQKLYQKTISQIQTLQNFLSSYEENALADTYRSMSDSRKELVTPLILPESDFLAQWVNQPYIGKSFTPNDVEIYTENGERVRSKSEKIIADKLLMMGVPYKYECPLLLKGYGTVYPDFTTLNVRERRVYYLEHLGMMDNPEYCESAIRKIETYEKNEIFPGENLILTYETLKHPLDTYALELLIKKYLL